MENLRQRPKGNYNWEAEWSQLYILTEHWKSDLDFFKDDLRFLHHLIDKYFIWIIRKDNEIAVKEIIKNLHELKKQSEDLLKRVGIHLTHLADLIDNPFKYDSHKFRAEHERIENDFVAFVKSFRTNRKQTFLITEHVIESDSLGSILNHKK